MSSRSSEDELSEGDDVTIQIRAKVLQNFPDETVLVDADGKEILVEEREIL